MADKYSKHQAKEIERAASAKGVIVPGMSESDKLSAIISMYRQQLGVPEDRFPTSVVERDPEKSGVFVPDEQPGPYTSGEIKIPENTLDDYEELLSTIVHEFRHAKDAMAESIPLGIETTRKKHFLEFDPSLDVKGKPKYPLAEQAEVYLIQKLREEADARERERSASERGMIP